MLAKLWISLLFLMIRGGYSDITPTGTNTNIPITPSQTSILTNSLLRVFFRFKCTNLAYSTEARPAEHKLKLNATMQAQMAQNKTRTKNELNMKIHIFKTVKQKIIATNLI